MIAESRAENRLSNLLLVLNSAGSIARFARAYELSYGTLIHAKSTRQLVSAALARDVEKAVGLPKNWMDARHDALPPAVRIAIAERSTKPPGDDAIEALRLRNVHWVVGEQRGAKAQFCRHVGWAEARFQHLAARAFGQLKARNLESKLELPQGWLDQEHSQALDLPEAFEDRLARLKALHAPAALAQASALAAVPDPRIQSPVVRALVEKLSALAVANKVPELKALQLLNEVMELERA